MHHAVFKRVFLTKSTLNKIGCNPYIVELSLMLRFPQGNENKTVIPLDRSILSRITGLKLYFKIREYRRKQMVEISANRDETEPFIL